MEVNSINRRSLEAPYGILSNWNYIRRRQDNSKTRRFIQEMDTLVIRLWKIVRFTKRVWGSRIIWGKVLMPPGLARTLSPSHNSVLEIHISCSDPKATGWAAVAPENPMHRPVISSGKGSRWTPGALRKNTINLWWQIRI